MMQAAARWRAERINMAIIARLSERRVRSGEGQGERAPAGAARPAMELAVITETQPKKTIDGKPLVVEVTEPDCRTAIRRLPAVLRKMDERDARRVAAERYAHAVEKVGSIAGASAEGAKSDGGPATNDGGVTTRIQYAETIYTVERTITEVGSVLRPQARGGGFRRAISARALIDAVCLDGRDMAAILQAHGWSGHRRDVATLSRAAEDCLERMARALGLVPEDAPRPDADE